MTESNQVTRQIQVPAKTGLEGFLHAVREIIRKPQVLRIVIERTGTVLYTQRTENDEGEEDNIGISFDHLEPYAIIRNSATRELTYPPTLGASEVLTSMFDELALNGYAPICFVVSPNTELWNWIYFSSGIEVHHTGALLGYPLYEDKEIPDTALILCAGIGTSMALIDTKLAVKVEMLTTSVLHQEMEIL
jgi:hypothetical protein